jgi:hypothetical protein
MARLFISHSSLNNNKAIEVRDWLARNGGDDVFLDLDPERGIAAGQRWKEALQKAAWRCEVVVALVSKEWLASSWCKSEVDAARVMGKKVIAALVGIDNAVAILVGKHGIGNTQQTGITKICKRPRSRSTRTVQRLRLDVVAFDF